MLQGVTALIKLGGIRPGRYGQFAFYLTFEVITLFSGIYKDVTSLSAEHMDSLIGYIASLAQIASLTVQLSSRVAM